NDTLVVAMVNIPDITYCDYRNFKHAAQDIQSQRVWIIPYVTISEGNINGLEYEAFRSKIEKDICQVMFLRKHEVLLYLEKLDKEINIKRQNYLDSLNLQ